MSLFAEDQAFVERLLAGDETAYDELLHVHAQKVYRFALARVGDAHTAEDLTQNALVKALPKLGEFRAESSLLTWLCAFCRFEILAHLRKQKTRRVEVELPDDIPEIERALELTGTSLSEPAETRLLHKERAYLIRALLDRLPGRYGDVLEWKYLEGLAVEEIAHRLDVTRTAAQSLLARARKAFRDGFTELAAATREIELGSP